MNVLYRQEDFCIPAGSIVITIGFFDGVHRGHQHILEQLQSLSPGAHKCVISFTNHPSEILRPGCKTSVICTLPHKIALLQKAQINTLLLLPFTAQLSGQSAEHFIQTIRNNIPFSGLLLGHDATLGNKRQGTKAAVSILADRLGFKSHYAEEYTHHGKPVSSTIIRQHLTGGNLDVVSELLGRPYSVYSTVRPGLGKGRLIGFPTINIPVDDLCLPPRGVYTVTLKYNSNFYPGIANLGIAPTIKNIDSPLLEAHLFSFSEDLYDKEVEVIFHRFIRPEKKFSSIEELKKQIQNDIVVAKQSIP